MPDDEDDWELFLDAVEKFEKGLVPIDKEVETEPTKPEKKKAGDEVEKVDLHGHSLTQAKQRIDELFQSRPRGVVRIITGKGRHSEFGSVLPREIYDYIRSQYGSQVKRMTECPVDATINGIPTKGHFDIEVT